MERLISIVFYNRSKRFRSIYDIMIINYGEKEISQENNNMSRVIDKDDIILRLKGIDDFNKEYKIDEGSVKFITKKANFKHI